MKTIIPSIALSLFLCQCAGTLGPYVWNQNPETFRFDSLDSAEKTAVSKMTGIWSLTIVSDEGQKRQLVCVYDKTNSAFHFLTLQDPTANWYPGELRYSFPYASGSVAKEFVGMAYIQGNVQSLFGSKKDRNRRGTMIQATIEPKQIIIKYMDDTDGGQNLDGTALIRGSIQILKKNQ